MWKDKFSQLIYRAKRKFYDAVHRMEERDEMRRREAEEKIPRLEAELATLEEELFGPAASDYVRAAEIEARRAEIEEELLSLYELTM